MIKPHPEQMTFEQAGAFQMTAEQRAVWNVLREHRGRAAAIRIRTLVTVCSLPERKVREIVTSLILVFHLRIGSVYSGSHPGYFVIETGAEAEATYEVLRGHALSILRRAAVIRRLSFPDLVGQLMIGEEVSR